MEAPLPPDEKQRLASLRELKVLDTDPEQAYDDLTRIASQLCGTPIALVSLIDEDRQWFKAKVGVEAHSTPRSMAFCAHAILGREIFEIPDATRDPRFHDNPLVTGETNIRFYAGTPLVTRDGHAMGTLCVIDRTPRDLSPEQRLALEALGRQIVAQLELRRLNLRMKRDLVSAAKVQQSYLPASPPAAEHVDAAWVYQPCDELGGDIFNLLTLDERTLGFYLLDVSGHGVAASLMSVAASRLLMPLENESSLVRRREKPGRPWQPAGPAAVAAGLNQRFSFDVDTQQYFTILYGLIDLKTFHVRLVSAGHPGPVIAPLRGEPCVAELEGLPIGLSDQAEYEERSFRLNQGDRLILHSDGVTEAMSPGQELFGQERLIAAVNRTRRLPLGQSLREIADAANGWSDFKPQDDISLLGLEVAQA